MQQQAYDQLFNDHRQQRFKNKRAWKKNYKRFSKKYKKKYFKEIHMQPLQNLMKNNAVKYV